MFRVKITTLALAVLPLVGLLLLLLCLFNGPFSRTTWVTRTRKINHSGFYWSKKWSDSGISWTICKSFAPRSRQIPRQYLATQFLQARFPSCHPMNSIKALPLVKLSNSQSNKYQLIGTSHWFHSVSWNHAFPMVTDNTSGRAARHTGPNHPHQASYYSLSIPVRAGSELH